MGYKEIMRKFAKKSEECSRKSVDDLLVLANGDEIEFLQSLETALQQKSERIGEDDLSEEEIIVLAVKALDDEVNNGGYSQFFVNSSREFTPIIVHALVRIGCPESAEITKRAVKAAGFRELAPEAFVKALDSYSNDYFRRNQHRFINPERISDIEGLSSECLSANTDSDSNAVSDSVEKELDECDQLYYGLYHRTGEYIGGKLIDFVKANKNAIQP